MNLITDRTAADATLKKELAAIGYDNMSAEQKALWDAGLKGSYNASDLNRVGAACAELYALLIGAGYAVNGYVALRTNWADTARPTPAELAQYIGTVAAIKSALPTSTLIPSTMRRLTVEGANNIERLLLEVEDILTRLKSIYIKSGVYHCGATLHVLEASI